MLDEYWSSWFNQALTMIAAILNHLDSKNELTANLGRMHVARQVANFVVEHAPAVALGAEAPAPVGADHVLTLLRHALAHAACLGAQATHHTRELPAASHALPSGALARARHVPAACKQMVEE